MFKIKHICFDDERKLCVTDGIKVALIKKNTYLTTPSFWGKIRLNLGAFPQKTNEEHNIISCDSFVSRPTGDGFIELCLFDENDFSKSDIDDEKFVGYIMIVEKARKSVKTNSEKVLFRRWPLELVAVLESNGDYVEVDGFRFEYENKNVLSKSYV